MYEMNDWSIVGEITSVETFAEGSGIRELRRLIEAYGGKNWRKRKGFATIRFESTGYTCDAEVHWYEAHGIGKVEMKIKELL
jgi:hypothetical protein